ncbi:hypothetical protein Sgly_1910 [Syntrophobotulus glycolicus DSM 8271]|uniref:Stage III sporulation protein AH n=1 Tax=Syntrophobotulus glycolicus (strain DSM 8271 / FlGlyR) TaxID=645991 RepID=F0T0R7_SYNGF|nr:SpoIIIAH-like family protein [Syntrophobotulus glycolicus]ADY56206.1 hypothetical protein Sgly_1910 [Syntrophobotulus glycolicus DSM 8271]
MSNKRYRPYFFGGVTCYLIVILAAVFLFHAKSSYSEVGTEQNSREIIFKSELGEPAENGRNYFVNYRLKREEYREESKEMLKVLLQSDVAKNREEAQTRWLELSKKMAQEGEIENILKLKGFEDLVAEVNQQAVKVVLFSPSLTTEEINTVKNVVKDIVAQEAIIEVLVKYSGG